MKSVSEILEEYIQLHESNQWKQHSKLELNFILLCSLLYSACTNCSHKWKHNHGYLTLSIENWELKGKLRSSHSSFSKRHLLVAKYMAQLASITTCNLSWEFCTFCLVFGSISYCTTMLHVCMCMCCAVYHRVIWSCFELSIPRLFCTDVLSKLIPLTLLIAWSLHSVLE